MPPPILPTYFLCVIGAGHAPACFHRFRILVGLVEVERNCLTLILTLFLFLFLAILVPNPQSPSCKCAECKEGQGHTAYPLHTHTPHSRSPVCNESTGK
mmetsp:Transcript_19448/g.56705  ORF Transcript_19448/g.56705 Transcript_19448/m.56705 type:complete len:99 (+) Transcript_19448:1439-1735(+)